jgi:hypothetical protein
MAVELIGLGRIANDGTGDDLRTAFIKVNNALEQLDLRSGESTTVTNLGGTGEGVFAQSVATDLQFKEVVQGDRMTISSTATGIIFSAVDQTSTIIGDTGSGTISNSSTFTIDGGDGISTAITGSTLTITNEGLVELADDISPVLGATLQASQNSILDADIIQANNFQGSLDGLVYGIDVRTISATVNGFDFGNIVLNVTSSIEFLLLSLDIEFGTILSPAALEVDQGGI